MKEFNILTEGRYDPVSEIEYKILRQHKTDDSLHLVYTGVLKTNDRYIKKQTGVIVHTLEATVKSDTDINAYIKHNRWNEVIASEIAKQVSNPMFARYNFSFLNSVHNSAIKTRA
tara:strand:+ start:218 stop:562 length:345 start_codon:yes stop_codon:yes gene_type:complete